MPNITIIVTIIVATSLSINIVILNISIPTSRKLGIRHEVWFFRLEGERN